MTVPALGCPGVSRWDLTRHGLSSLPYSPFIGAEWARVPRGEGKSFAVDFLCFVQTFVDTTVHCPLSNKNLHCYTVRLKIVVDSYILGAVHSKLYSKVV